MRPTATAVAQSFSARIQVKTYPFNSIMVQGASSSYQHFAIHPFISESNLIRPVVERRRLPAFSPRKNKLFTGFLLWHIHCGGIGVCLRRLHEMSRSADEESKDTVGGRGDVLKLQATQFCLI
jgi:hypothetical protein